MENAWRRFLLLRHLSSKASEVGGEGKAGGVSRGLDRRSGGGGAMNVFDRQAKKLQRARAAVAKDAHLYDYLKDHVIKMGVAAVM